MVVELVASLHFNKGFGNQIGMAWSASWSILVILLESSTFGYMLISSEAIQGGEL